MMMTSRERFLKVLQGEMPDRVPVTLFIQDQGHFLIKLSARRSLGIRNPLQD
jgi:uroporphyrinogen-III decarboxylase